VREVYNVKNKEMLLNGLPSHMAETVLYWSRDI